MIVMNEIVKTIGVIFLAAVCGYQAYAQGRKGEYLLAATCGVSEILCLWTLFFGW